MSKPSLTGALIQQWREYRGLDRVTLARRVGVSQPSVIQWENGDTAPRNSRMARIVAALNCTMSEFYQGPPGEPTSVAT